MEFRRVRFRSDPQLAEALHVTRDGAPRGLDLTRRQAAGSEGLQAIGAKVQLGAALGLAVDSALEGLPVFRSLRLQHNCRSSNRVARRSEERRVGKGCANTCRSRGAPDLSKNKQNKIK